MSASDVAAGVVRDGDALRFTGTLDRDAAAALWPRAAALRDGVRRLDLAAVDRVDSAGVALLAELAAGIDGVAIDGSPAGLAELRAAYRLTPALAFAA